MAHLRGLSDPTKLIYKFGTRNENNNKESLWRQNSLPFVWAHFPRRLIFSPGNKRRGGATTTQRCKLGCGYNLKILSWSSDKALRGYSETGWMSFSERQSCLRQLSSERADCWLYCQAWHHWALRSHRGFLRVGLQEGVFTSPPPTLAQQIFSTHLFFLYVPLPYSAILCSNPLYIIYMYLNNVLLVPSITQISPEFPFNVWKPWFEAHKFYHLKSLK